MLNYIIGGYQKNVGQDFLLGISQPVVSRCVTNIAHIIDKHLGDKHIQFPQTLQEMRKIKLT